MQQAPCFRGNSNSSRGIVGSCSTGAVAQVRREIRVQQSIDTEDIKNSHRSTATGHLRQRVRRWPASSAAHRGACARGPCPPEVAETGPHAPDGLQQHPGTSRMKYMMSGMWGTGLPQPTHPLVVVCRTLRAIVCGLTEVVEQKHGNNIDTTIHMLCSIAYRPCPTPAPGRSRTQRAAAPCPGRRPWARNLGGAGASRGRCRCDLLMGRPPLSAR